MYIGNAVSLNMINLDHRGTFGLMCQPITINDAQDLSFTHRYTTY